ncbi:MAG: OmpH family outer membrane protein [Desulfurobacteriaceae bacterium]
MRKLLLAGLILAASMGIPKVSKAEAISQTKAISVYYVDIQKVVENSNKWKEVENIINSQIREAREKLQKLDSEIRSLQSELKSPILSQKAKEEKEKELQQKLRERERYIQQINLKIQKMGNARSLEIISEVVRVIDEYRKEHNIPLIIDKRAVISGNPKYDLTETITKIYNGKVEK